MIMMERVIFWGDIQTVKERFQILNCTQLNVKIHDLGKTVMTDYKKTEVMEDHFN